MKKILGMLLACMCLCTNLVMAADGPDTSTDDHVTKLTYEVSVSYKWSAPADFSFTDNVDAETKQGTVSVIENIIPGDATLKISICPDETFKLTSGEGATRDYKVLKGEAILDKGSLVLAVPSGVNDDDQELNFTLVGVVNESTNTSQVAGTFKGTLNFVANIESTGSGAGGEGGESGGSSGGTGGSEGGTGGSTISKGDILTMAQLGYVNVDMNGDDVADTFRALSVDGNQAKVLAMDSYKSTYFNTAGYNTYADKTLDTEMTNYYNALPSNVQSAIVAQDINQGTYSRSSSAGESDVLHITDLNSNNYYYANTATANVGNRNVYALDIQDITDYLGNDITGAQLNEMFFNSSESVSRNVWLRSATAVRADFAFRVYGNDGYVDFNLVDGYKYEVRPAFVLNLG